MAFKIGTKKILSEQNISKIIMLGIGLRDELSNMELGLISDYDNTKTYTRGQAVYYNNYLYKCLYTTTGTWDSTKWQKIGDELGLITKQDIEAMLGLTQEEIETLQKIINDSQITLSTTFSSSRIYSDLQQCLSDSKAFTLSKLASTMTASFEIATSTADMTEGNILYLLNTGANTYDIYALIEGTPKVIASTTIDLSQYAKLTDLDNYYDKATSDGKYATITTVDGKIDKTSILSAISSTPSDDNLLSEKAINDTLVKKTDITTTIDDTSTDSELPTAKSVWDSLYELRDPQILVDANKPTSRICEADLTTLNTPAKEGLTDAQASLIISAYGNATWNGQISISTAEPSVYVRSVRDVAGDWTKWRRLCSTGVADVPVTNIAPTDTTTFVNFAGNSRCNYCVKNGICYVTLWDVKITKPNEVTPDIILPKCGVARVGAHLSGSAEAEVRSFVCVTEEGRLYFYTKQDAIDMFLYGSFSYPVAEN